MFSMHEAPSLWGRGERLDLHSLPLFFHKEVVSLRTIKGGNKVCVENLPDQSGQGHLRYIWIIPTINLGVLQW
uniref:Uncharacterized protein n=1 Tax=Rhizophora mucronata TaxID=61149 RepID=A0A2P2PW10_RHIMU